eukprot:3472142-Amphidinium_carterae.1
MMRGCRGGSHKRRSGTPCPKQQAKPVGLQPDLEVQASVILSLGSVSRCHTATKVTCVASDDKVTCVAIDGSNNMPAMPEVTRRDIMVAVITLVIG